MRRPRDAVGTARRRGRCSAGSRRRRLALAPFEIRRRLSCVNNTHCCVGQRREAIGLRYAFRSPIEKKGRSQKRSWRGEKKGDREEKLEGRGRGGGSREQKSQKGANKGSARHVSVAWRMGMVAQQQHQAAKHENRGWCGVSGECGINHKTGLSH